MPRVQGESFILLLLLLFHFSSCSPFCFSFSFRKITNQKKGHHSWLRAPCGAEIAVCDGLMHHFAKFEKKHDDDDEGNDGNDEGEGRSVTTWRVFFGAGALGKTFTVKAPPETPVTSSPGDEQDDDVSRCHRRRRRHHDDNGDDGGDGKWAKVRMEWTSEGLSGQAWTAKKVGGGWGGEEEENGNDNTYNAIAAEARAALADAGLAVLPDRDAAVSSSSSSSPAFSREKGAGALRSLASRVAPFLSPSSLLAAARADPLSGGIRARATCNGEEPRWRGAPCKGEAKMEWSSSSGSSDAHGTAVCDGFWSGAGPVGGHKCLGFSQVSASKGAWSMWRHCSGASGSKIGGGGGCPWHRNGGKKGMASWCHGGSSGAIVKKPEDEGCGDVDAADETVEVVRPQEKMTTV